MRKLTYKEQIHILKLVLADLNSDEEFYKCVPLYYDTHGLCYRIKTVLRDQYEIDVLDRYISDYIPIFNIRNANKYGNANYRKDLWWWTTVVDKGALDQRRVFVKWMIKELKLKSKHPILYWIVRNVFRKR